MKITIDNYNYHIGNLSDDDISYIKRIVFRMLNKYKEVGVYIKKIFKLHGRELKAIYEDPLIIRIYAGFLHSLKDDETIMNEERMLKVLKCYTKLFLEPIFNNRALFSSSYPVYYEPKVVAVIAFTNYVTRQLSNEFDEQYASNETLTYDSCFFAEFINGCRTLKSSMMLLAIGDDVHAIGLFRGMVEIFSKIKLAPKYPSDYVKFKEYNLHLQINKTNGTPLPEQMVKDLGSKAKDESYICYGWAKNSHGKRITTMIELVQQAYLDTADMRAFLHLSSELIHEDYVGVGYDFLSLRKEVIDQYYHFTKAMFEIIKNEKGAKEFRPLFDTIK